MSGPTTNRKSLVVFASGRGTNFRALCHAAAQNLLPARIEALITSVRHAPACEVASEYKIPVFELPHQGKTREVHETEILRVLEAVACDWIVLAGYMRIFTPGFVGRFWEPALSGARIVNIHPSLLPSFPGKDGYAQALREGVRVTGATVHLVGSGLDDGPIVAQRALAVRDDDTLESLTGRGLELEHALYVEALGKLFTQPWTVTTGAVAGGRPRVVFGRTDR